jgi:hypothetical protein
VRIRLTRQGRAEAGGRPDQEDAAASISLRRVL